VNKAREFDQSVLAELKALLGERVSTSAAVREHHGKDESYFPYAPPDAVVFVESTEEVRDVVDICRRHRVPMIPFGVGTSLEGHILAVQGGVSIDLSRMNKVLAVHQEDLDAVVQAGVTRKQLNEYIKHTGLFFPVDPGADATLGGMAATRASGTNAVRYGTMRENVLSLKVVLADGRIIQTSRRAKSPPRATTSPASSSARKARSASSPRSACGSTRCRRRCRRRCAPSTRSTAARAP